MKLRVKTISFKTMKRMTRFLSVNNSETTQISLLVLFSQLFMGSNW